MFHCLPDSAWPDRNLAEAAGQDGGISQIKVNPTQVYQHMGRPVENVHRGRCRARGAAAAAGRDIERDRRVASGNRVEELPSGAHYAPSFLPSLNRSLADDRN